MHPTQLLEDSFKRLLSTIVPARPAFPADVPEVLPPIPKSLLKAEVEALPADQRLAATGALTVLYARAGQIPWCLQEIGRLRELSFRAAGEGTGRASDVDLFDAYYLHLFVWDAGAEAIVGAYRMGLTDEILARYGKRGLYTHSLFKYGAHVLRALNPAIELGRSFVRAEYQRSFAALMLLWRGIGRFVARSPRHAVLFGPVSISNSYDPLSRHLIVDYLEANSTDSGLARHVKPRRPFRERKPADWDASAHPRDIDQVSRMVERIERDHKGVPILLKHYLKLGGRMLGFNTDREFADALDGLVMVDLRASDPRVLARYMGEEDAAGFLAWHGIGPDALRRAS